MGRATSRSDAEFSPGVRRLILVRAGDACEVCGIPGRLEIHHRKYKSRGGLGTAANGVALCGWGNHTGHHGWAHTDPQAALWGVSLHSWDDPLTQPIWHDLSGTWRRLDDAGGWAAVA